jgi:hypothetical protein
MARLTVTAVVCLLSAIGFGLAVSSSASAQSVQQQVDQARAAMQDARMLYMSCAGAVVQKPAYRPLLPHTQNLDTGKHTAAQLADETFPSAADAALLAARFNDFNECRAQYLAVVSPVRPDLVPIVVDSYTAWDETSAQLAQRKITWAEAARRTEVANAAAHEKIAAAQHVWIAEMRSKRRDELKRRDEEVQNRAAAVALARWANARRMMNGLMHPVITGGR